MALGSECHSGIHASKCVGDLIAVCRHDDIVGDTERRNAFPDADHQGHSANEAKRLSRESGRRESRGDDGERLHAGPGRACGAANCTPLKLHRSPAIAKQPEKSSHSKRVSRPGRRVCAQRAKDNPSLNRPSRVAGSNVYSVRTTLRDTKAPTFWTNLGRRWMPAEPIRCRIATVGDPRPGSLIRESGIS